MITTLKAFLICLFAFACVVLSSPVPVSAQVTGTIQIASSDESLLGTLQPRQLCITYPHGGTTGAYTKLWIGSATGNILLLNTAGGVSGVTNINSKTGAITLNSDSTLTVGGSGSTITYGLAPLAVDPTGVYAYPSSISVDSYGHVTAASAGSAPATTLPPSGPATGDLSGNYPGPTVAAIRSIPVSSTTPTANQVLEFISGQYVPTSLTSTSGGTVTTFSASFPSWLTPVVTNATTTPALGVTATTGIAANQFLATPDGATGALGTRAIVAGDLAGIPYVSTSRQVIAGTGLSGGGALGSNVTLALASTAVTAGSYTNANITVGTDGRITAASNGSSGSGGGGSVTLSGDVTGPSGSNTVVKLQGNAVSTTSPPTGYALVWNGSAWSPESLNGDAYGLLSSTVVGSIRGTSVDATTPTNGQVLIFNSSLNEWQVSTAPWVVGTAADSETPSGTVNGSNTSFTLAHTPRNGSLHLYVDGKRVGPSGYSVAGTTLTITVAPTSSVLVDYRY